MTTTLTGLTTICRDAIGDPSAATFSDAILQDYINLAIADLNNYFPKRSVATISTVLNQQVYELPISLISAVSVEYPTSETPPKYLTRRAYTHPLFNLVEGYYDVFIRQDQTVGNPPTLYLSVKPPAGKTITVWYNSEHSKLLNPGDATTILDRHLYLIPLRVRWSCWAELATVETMDPDPLHTPYPTKEKSANLAETAYRAALATAIATDAESGITPWTMDRFDRIY